MTTFSGGQGTALSRLIIPSILVSSPLTPHANDQVVDTTVTTIQSVFGNTPLEAPILDVLNCVVLMKIQSIQNGLTFVNEHARVQFPRVDNSSLNVLESSGP